MTALNTIKVGIAAEFECGFPDSFVARIISLFIK